jgi:hypothetical protein
MLRGNRWRDLSFADKQGSQRPMVQNQENRQDTFDEKIRNFDKNQDNINRL